MRELINMFKQKGYLLHPTILNANENQIQQVYSKLIPVEDSKIKIIDEELFYKLLDNKTAVKYETKQTPETKIKLIQNYIWKNEKRKIQDFVTYYTNRFAKLSSILKNREELSKTVSINLIQENETRETIAVIGMIDNLHTTPTQNITFTLEDQTGTIKAIITKKNAELYQKALNLVNDEVIGVTGSKARGVIFPNNILFPEIPNSLELKKSREDINIAFISDIHTGSIDFLEKKFDNFIKWTNGQMGNEEQKQTSEKLKYLFVIGDLVDGVGIYPTQESELMIKDVYKQFDYFTELIKQIPEHIQIIMCPGNHDPLRLSEPQPPLTREFLKTLVDYKNITLVSNPATINVHAINDFPGLNVLMYHGYSFDYYCNEIPIIRNAGGYDKMEVLLEFLLKKRHLAPTHGSTLIEPGVEDHLVITEIPDVFVTGHVHKSAKGIYNNINTISSSCFQGPTDFQEKLGHRPTPGHVPILNMKTRKVKIMEF